MLPDVLIVSIERFKNTSSKNCMNIEPSDILKIEETLYSFNTVVTHYGSTARKGNYIATARDKYSGTVTK